ncbi:MAG: pseudouridine synthase [bacterium]
MNKNYRNQRDKENNRQGNYRNKDERPGYNREGSSSDRKLPGIKRKRIETGDGSPRKRLRPRIKKDAPKTGDGKMRLNKYLSNAGLCSRREADKYIEEGLITINGEVVTTLGTKVSPEDDVRFNQERVVSEKKVYILMNKPKDYITTVDDPNATKTVMDLLKDSVKERVYPVGRLDRNTTGVLLLTNDGDMTSRLTHPKYNKRKIYHVFIDKNITSLDMRKMVEGLPLEDGFIRVDAVNYVTPGDKKQIGVEIHSGKYHIVKRIFEYLGYNVIKLDRVYFAGLTKKGLKRGDWRYLDQGEINMLKMNAYK